MTRFYATLIFISLVFTLIYSNSFISTFARPKVPLGGPVIADTTLKTELVVSGLKAPTSMAFLGPNNIFVTEKNSGMVQRVVNGTISKVPLVQLNVTKADERGLLGVALSASKNKVFLYYTKVQNQNKSETIVNSVYSYDVVKDKLANPRLLLKLPGLPGPQHNGGKLAIGTDDNLYITIGDVGGSFVGKDSETKAQNYMNGSEPDGRAGIIRITQDGKPVGNGIVGSAPILNTYYAYGIKNIFGFDFDPVTGKMWDTENGPTFGDEINLVEPGFNSGWVKVQGIWYVQSQEGQKTEPGKGEKAPENPTGLVDFGGKGTYSSPEFTWDHSVAPTALRFLNSGKLGAQYENEMFVGDAKYGNIYHFRLNQNRSSLSLDGPLVDRIADKVEEMGNTIFGRGFGVITDLQVGPDGYLYVLVYDKDDGRIYRIFSMTR
ncbi:MAG TPA: PQQ-dependent sugar dehydrogenase [Nitrososphaeraceae archaeon]